MRNVICLVVLLASSVASAETYDATQPLPEKNAYANVGASIGTMRALRGGFYVDGGMRLADTPLFAHALLESGKSGSDGSYQQARGGIEARSCRVAGWLCAFAGLDVGYQHDHVVDEMLFSDTVYMTNSHDLLAVPRVGIEVGRQLRFRLALEIPMFQSIDEDERGGGGEVSAGLGYAF